jgi:hypothetical protein
MALFGHAVISKLSLPLSVKRKLDVDSAKGCFWRRVQPLAATHSANFSRFFTAPLRALSPTGLLLPLLPPKNTKFRASGSIRIKASQVLQLSRSIRPDAYGFDTNYAGKPRYNAIFDRPLLAQSGRCGCLISHARASST